jgi:response regulator of citrate/malate metabolism
MKTLLIDDIRNLKADRVARNYEEGIKALKEEKWDLLLLDHDLGQEDGKDGTGIMNWLEENQEYLPGKIELVTSNPVGRDRMNTIIKKIYEGKRD